MAKKENVDFPASKMLSSIMDILKKEGYIDDFKPLEDKKQGILRVYLKYVNAKSAIRNIKRISKPGLRVYKESKNIPSILRGRGLAVVSTSKGIITDKQAREQKAGGEIIAYVW